MHVRCLEVFVNSNIFLQDVNFDVHEYWMDLECNLNTVRKRRRYMSQIQLTPLFNCSEVEMRI